MSPAALEELRRRRKIALARLDACIDVLCAWRGRYEDDGRPVTLWWVSELIPPADPRKLCGWLCVTNWLGADTGAQGIGWAVIDGRLVLRSRCGTLQAAVGPVTRRQFREAAQRSGVSLPARHATLYLREGCPDAGEGADPCRR